MNKYLKALIVVIVLPIAVVLAVFLAQTLAIDAHVVAQQDTLQQRVEQYKKKLQTQPTQADLNKLKLRCNVAQDRLKSVSERAKKVQEKRTASYDSINKSLQDLIVVLKAKSISTTNLEAQSKELKSKTDAFSADLKTFQQATEDASTADCAGDPLALKASLENARVAHTKLLQEVSDIRVYIKNVIKVTLKQIREDIVTQQKASTEVPATSTQATGGATNATQ